MIGGLCAVACGGIFVALLLAETVLPVLLGGTRALSAPAWSIAFLPLSDPSDFVRGNHRINDAWKTCLADMKAPVPTCGLLACGGLFAPRQIAVAKPSPIRHASVSQRRRGRPSRWIMPPSYSARSKRSNAAPRSGYGVKQRQWLGMMIGLWWGPPRLGSATHLNSSCRHTARAERGSVSHRCRLVLRGARQVPDLGVQQHTQSGGIVPLVMLGAQPLRSVRAATGHRRKRHDCLKQLQRVDDAAGGNVSADPGLVLPGAFQRCHRVIRMPTRRGH